jgi:hypothetical protein
MFIPRNIDSYDAIKQELSQYGIGITKTTIPPNLEEFVGVLLFGGSMICAFSVHNVPLLIANLILSILLSIGCFSVINSDPDVKWGMRYKRWAAFLPTVLAGVGLWLATRGN